MKKISAYDEFRNLISPRIPCLSGRTRSTSARNVALIDKKYFDILVGFISNHTTTEPPGPIVNEELFSKIDRKENIFEGVDYEILEVNVFELTMKFFGGGPFIQRPLLMHPATKEGIVIPYPVKFHLNIEGRIYVKTIDRDWDTTLLKMSISAQFKVDATRASIRSCETNGLVPDSITAQQILNLYGANLYFDILDCTNLGMSASRSSPQNKIIAQNSSNMTFSVGPSLSSNTSTNSIIASQLQLQKSQQQNLQDGKNQMNKQDSSQKLMSSGFMSQQEKPVHQNLMTSLLHCLCRLLPIIKMYSNMLDRNAPDESESNPLANYIGEIEQTPETVTIPPRLMNLLMNDRDTSIQGIKHFEVQLLLDAMLSILNIRSFFNYETSGRVKCKKCNHHSLYKQSQSILCLDMPSIWYRKTKLEDCVENWTNTKHKYTAVCSKCGKSCKHNSTRKFESFPQIFAIVFDRFKREKNGVARTAQAVSYPTSLCFAKLGGSKQDVYKLCALTSFSGQFLNQKYKSYVFIPKSNSWLFFSESRFREIDQSSVFENSTAWVLFYVHQKLL